MQSIQPPTTPSETHPNAPSNGSRLRTVTGNRFHRKCACGCGHAIPRDPEIRYVVDFGAPTPYPAYLREHSPDYGSYRGSPAKKEDASPVPAFRPASEVLRETAEIRARETAHEETDVAPSPEAGRSWAFSQLVFNPGSFESVRAGFASYAREKETERDLRARVHSTVLADVEQQVMALRALHAKIRDREGGPSFGEIVARSRPKAEA